MLCQFEKLIYPQCAKTTDIGGYMVAVYSPCEKILDTSGNLVRQIKAVGYCLPIALGIRYDMQGHWSKNTKHGIQFEVENYEEVVIPNRQGIVAYLSSGQIRGIGPVLADRIYDTFGDNTLDILDREPEKFLGVKGISESKLQKIMDSYLANRGARDVVAFLAPHGITPNRAVKLYREYGNKTMEIVKEHPYRLCEMAGIGFATADRIAMSMGFDKLSTERVDEGLLYTLADAEGKGHLCMEKHAFIKACLKILNTEELTDEMLANRAIRLLHTGKLVDYDGNVYRTQTAKAEIHLSDAIIRQSISSHGGQYADLEAELDGEEAILKLRLAPEQRDAVKMALTNGLSIVTGGPGTGKTLIQRAILDIYRKNHPNAEICCCAPTGRAARRMAQSTGYPASTVHKALGLIARDDGSYGKIMDAFGGENIEISATSKNHINAMDINMDYADGQNPVTLKSEYMLSLCEQAVCDLGPKQKSLIDRCTANLLNGYMRSGFCGRAPTLKDFYEELKAQPEPEAKDIALSLELFTSGSLDTFAGETNVDTKNRLICYDIHDLGRALMPIGMLVVLDNILNRITANKARGRKTYIFIDEIYLLFKHEYSANFLFTLWKRVRKYGAFITGITQNVEDLLQSHTARTMLANSELVVMLNQAATDREELASLMGISDLQMGYITNVDAGHGLVKIGGALVPFVNKVPRDTKLYALMTTKFGE